FCKSKCSYCNFASGVFSREKYSVYCDRLGSDITRAPELAAAMGTRFERQVDSIYLGGGTPTVLAPEQLARIFDCLRENFEITPDAEITVECAPGTLSPEII